MIDVVVVLSLSRVPSVMLGLVVGARVMNLERRDWPSDPPLRPSIHPQVRYF